MQSRRYNFDGKKTLRITDLLPDGDRADSLEKVLDTLRNRDAA